MPLPRLFLESIIRWIHTGFCSPFETSPSPLPMNMAWGSENCRHLLWKKFALLPWWSGHVTFAETKHFWGNDYQWIWITESKEQAKNHAAFGTKNTRYCGFLFGSNLMVCYLWIITCSSFFISKKIFQQNAIYIKRKATCLLYFETVAKKPTWQV